MREFKNESGQALLLVMMVLMVILLIGSAALTRTGGSRTRSFEQKKIVQASYIAEAGIEKALATIKNNPYWLKGLAYDTANDFITSLDYAGGQITSVKVKRTSSTGVYPTEFYLESTGEYQGATRTLRVKGEMYDPVDFARGLWVEGNTEFSNGSEYNTSVTCRGDLIFKNNTTASGDILAAGNISLENNMTARSIVSGGTLTVAENVYITAPETRAGGDIKVLNRGRIDGAANAWQSIEMGSNACITGGVRYNGHLNMGSNSTTGSYLGPATHVEVSIPPFPSLEESLYSQNYDRELPGTLTGTSDAPIDVNGISYAPGDLLLAGIYTGNGIIVAHGKVTITGALMRKEGDTQSSLAIISFGNVNGVGIEVSNNFTVYALLYTPNSINLNNNIYFHGSLICKGAIIDNNVKVTYEPALHENQPPWMTTVVKIKSWKEKFSIF